MINLAAAHQAHQAWPFFNPLIESSLTLLAGYNVISSPILYIFPIKGPAKNDAFPGETSQNVLLAHCHVVIHSSKEQEGGNISCSDIKT